MRLFVGAIRNLDLFRKLYHKLENYDSVVGKIADDSTSRVLTSYVTGHALATLDLICRFLPYSL